MATDKELVYLPTMTRLLKVEQLAELEKLFTLAGETRPAERAEAGAAEHSDYRQDSGRMRRIYRDL